MLSLFAFQYAKSFFLWILIFMACKFQHGWDLFTCPRRCCVFTTHPCGCSLRIGTYSTVFSLQLPQIIIQDLSVLSLILLFLLFSASHSCSANTFAWKISLGRQTLEGENPNEVSIDVAQIVLHPMYDSDSSDNDIALLKLSSPVTFTDYIRPVCLAASDSVFNNGTDSWVTGWGRINEGGEFCYCWGERLI